MGVEVVLGVRLGVDGGGGVMGKVEKVNASRIGCGGDEVVFLRTVLHSNDDDRSGEQLDDFTRTVEAILRGQASINAQSIGFGYNISWV